MILIKQFLMIKPTIFTYSQNAHHNAPLTSVSRYSAMSFAKRNPLLVVILLSISAKRRHGGLRISGSGLGSSAESALTEGDQPGGFPVPHEFRQSLRGIIGDCIHIT
jgi:hypothetical protein